MIVFDVKVVFGFGITPEILQDLENRLRSCLSPSLVFSFSTVRWSTLHWRGERLHGKYVLFHIGHNYNSDFFFDMYDKWNGEHQRIVWCENSSDDEKIDFSKKVLRFFREDVVTGRLTKRALPVASSQ